MPVRPRVMIQTDRFDPGAEQLRLAELTADTGATVAFTGYCRSESGRLSALELEHYPGMAEKEITRIAEAAIERWDLNGVCAIHRVGRIAAGDQIVLVVTAAKHRTAAFESAQFIMDYLKTNAPFWKKEHASDGESGQWVEARNADTDLAARWKIREN